MICGPSAAQTAPPATLGALAPAGSPAAELAEAAQPAVSLPEVAAPVAAAPLTAPPAAPVFSLVTATAEADLAVSFAQAGPDTRRPRLRPVWMELRADGTRRPRPNPRRPMVDEALYAAPALAEMAAPGTASALVVPTASDADPQQPRLAQLSAPPSQGDVLPKPPGNVPQSLALMRTSDIQRKGFMQRRLGVEAGLLDLSGPALAAAALEIARLNLGQMLLPEARSWLARALAAGAGLDPELHGQVLVMQRMIEVLDGNPWAAPMPAPWEDELLWRLAAGDGVKPRPEDVTAAMAMLNAHSLPVIETLLPKLFDRALEAGALSTAEALLRGASEVTDLASRPIHRLMLGRLALRNGMPEQAFDYFAHAAAGNDLAAQQARIAMADIAIERRDPKLLPALRSILLDGVNQWRHGPEALVLRARLAQVAEDLGDIPLALDIMGKIRLDHPGTPEAVLAHERGALALAAFSVAMDAGEIDLESYLRTLRRVEPFYRGDPIWPIARGAIARAWAREGLHVASASEYAALRADLALLGAPEISERMRKELALAEAEAHLENGRADRAAPVLRGAGGARFEDLVARHQVAALQAGLPGALSTPPLETSVAALREHGTLARKAGQSDVALASYHALDARGALVGSGAEALQAVVVARNQGERAFAADLFARLEARPEFLPEGGGEALFSAMSEPLPVLQPLSRALADQMLGRSDAAIEASGRLIASGVSELDLTAPDARPRFAPEAAASAAAVAAAANEKAGVPAP